MSGNKTMELLEKLYYTTQELDTQYLNMMNHGKTDMTGEKYDEINDLLIEVGEFLGIE